MDFILECPKCKKQHTVKTEADLSKKIICKACNAQLQPVRPKPATTIKTEPVQPTTVTATAIPAKHKPSETKSNSTAGVTPQTGSADAFNLSDAPVDVIQAYNTKGTVIAGKYIIIKKLGQGGMGAVFQGWDNALKRYVAVKMILPPKQGAENPAEEADSVKRFMREARTSAKLIHPNVLQVHETGRHENNYYIAMEYVNGGTFDNYWEQRQLAPDKGGSQGKKHLKQPDRKALKDYVMLMKDVATAIDYAHKNNIIHRDIKPENILLSIGKNGELIPKVSDFGLAREVVSDKKLTIAGTVVGTPVFMSPEQATAGALNSKSDVFSIGSVLYKICTGMDPFSGKSPLDIMKAVVNKEPPEPSEVNKAVDKDLSIIIMKAMEKEKSRRYESAGELAADLGRYANGEPIKARPASITYKLTKKIKRNKTGFAGIAAGILILIITASVLWYRNAEREKHADEYILRADELYKTGKWKDANDYYIKYLELRQEDEQARRRADECGRKMRENEEKLRLEALQKEKEKQEIEARRKKEEEQAAIEKARIQAEKENEKTAMEEVQQAWFNANQVFTEFYKKNGNMDNAWSQINESIDMLTKTIEKHPTAMGHFYRAMLYREKMKLSEAEKDLAAALELKQDFDLAYIMKGIVYFEQYYLGKALMEELSPAQAKALQEELTANAQKNFELIKNTEKIPDQFMIYKEIFAAMKTADKNERLDLLEKGYSKSGSEEFLFWLALSYYMKRNYDSAEEYADKAIETKPQYAAAYFLMANLRMSENKPKKAVDCLTKSIRINPYFTMAYTNRGLAKHRNGDFAGAMDDYGKAIELNPDDATAYSNRGNAKSAMNDIDGAIEDFSAAVRINPDFAAAYFNRGNERLKKSGFKEAVADYDRAILLRPDYIKAYFNRAVAKIQSGNPKGAVEDYERILELEPGNADAYANRGKVFYNTGRYPEALNDFKKAVNLNPALKNELGTFIRELEPEDE